MYIQVASPPPKGPDMKKALLCLVPALLLGCFPVEPNPPDPVPGNASGPFQSDDGTVFLADFDSNAVNRVTAAPGTLYWGVYEASPFGFGVRPNPAAEGKYRVEYPNSAAFNSLPSGVQGTLEALVRYDAAQPGFAHIVEKAWQYAISAYNGKLAVSFGTDWWYSEVSLPVGRWSYVAASFDGTDLILYLNGEEVASTPYSGFKSYEYSTGYDLGIGNSSSSDFDIPFQGTIDAARVSRVVRAPGEIAASWQAIAKKL
jgi:hypothetical protein